jgi:hypothetical protein
VGFDRLSSQFRGLEVAGALFGVAVQSRQLEKFTAGPDRQGCRLQPWSYRRRDRDAAYRSSDGPPVRSGVETAHRPNYPRFANPSVIATGREGERLLQNAFEGFGKIDGNPFHISIVGRSEVSTKTVIRLDR